MTMVDVKEVVYFAPRGDKSQDMEPVQGRDSIEFARMIAKIPLRLVHLRILLDRLALARVAFLLYCLDRVALC